MLEIGSMLDGRYRVLHDVGRGGTGHVYLVLNERAGKQWAAKEVPKNKNGKNAAEGNGLITDAEMLKKLHHPNIPSIVDVIETGDMYYILMDYVEGMTLKETLNIYGPQTQENVVKWAIQLTDVFLYLHSQEPKIIYRDTKPANIMLRPDGNISLIDFGAAREYKPYQDNDTTALGSPGYAAPEQYEGINGQTDERTDIYNLGVTMYHLLTGHNPGQPPYDIYPIRHWDSSLSSGLEQIVLKCTQPNPEERYQNAGDLKYALEHYRDLDTDKKRKKDRILKTGMVFLICGVLFILASGISRNVSHRYLENGYDTVLKNAELATTKEKQIELYEKAINLQPRKGEAYQKLLDQVFLADDILDREEAEELTRILNNYGDGKQMNRLALENGPDIDVFSYEAGIAYFYYYEGSGNKTRAESWLETAAESDTLPQNKKERARRLGRISSYYAKLGKMDPAGDDEVSYGEYWNDLDDLTRDNIAAIDNAKTALVTYQELSYQIRMHAADFQRAGITEAEIREKMEQVEAHLEGDFSAEEKENYGNLFQNIQENLDAADEALEIAFQGENE